MLLREWDSHFGIKAEAWYGFWHKTVINIIMMMWQ
jgi:hypothetical protein